MLFLAFVMLNDHGISGHVFLISGHVFLISGHVGPPPSIDSWNHWQSVFPLPGAPQTRRVEEAVCLGHCIQYNPHNSMHEGLRSDYVCSDFNDQTYCWIILESEQLQCPISIPKSKTT